MASALTDRERWLALGLLAAVLLLGYLVLVHPWWTQPMLEVNERIQALRERELRVRTQLQQAPAVEKQLAAALALQAQRPGFLGEASTELATAGLVQRLEAVVKEASPGNRSCGIANQSPLPQATGERFARVAVQVRLRCGTPELAAVLHALESGSPRLFVDNLNILSSNYAYMAPEGGTGGLDVTFDLYGYLKPGVVAPAAPAAPAAMTMPEGGDAP
ncbi:type II secretion system protein GspM [Pseudoxanthomonas sp. z9]|uniref:type II secretion system protein GspM n=1 Tax=Pseudoxanthomonas sp. z9 TaxID=2584942 RepID=UPI0011430934|nr:type II secretion system protein GspM [Pseudoxanthomonas sp. z9]MCL6712176.1 type II secretion system protein GspM [Pseudomonas sp. R2.Fl]